VATVVLALCSRQLDFIVCFPHLTVDAVFGSIVEFATRGDMKNVIAKLDDTEINGRRIRIIEQKPRGRHGRYADCLAVCCCVQLITSLVLYISC